MMRLLVLLPLLLAALPAQADLYRWIDPQSGSVKLSSVPPPWHGDPAKEARSPKVEVIPYSAAPKPAPVAAPAPVGLPKPAPAASAPGAPAPAVDPGLLGALEARLRQMQAVLGAMPQRADFDRSGQALQQQVQAYEALAAELDRMDPAGAARRRREAETNVVEKIKKGLEAQFSTKPAAVK